MDIPLNDRGRKEAELAGRALSDVRLDAVYASDLSRARDTAEAIVKQQKSPCKLILDRRLREIHCGRLQGLTMAEARERFPEFYAALKEDPMGARRPGGESYEDLFQRSCRALEDVYNNYPRGNVAIVSHGGVIRCMLAYAAGEKVNPASPTAANGSISVITRDEDGWHVVKFNQVEHLASLIDPVEAEKMADSYRWE